MRSSTGVGRYGERAVGIFERVACFGFGDGGFCWSSMPIEGALRRTDIAGFLVKGHSLHRSL